ncbi:transaldolase [Brevibacterium luteolum]|uniref:transaldolase n=1 Tax=Brevibacterium luteolum TaxID=199591 RepID=UPI0015848639|nr:transaldolase [Brevibacterium luteolum]
MTDRLAQLSRAGVSVWLDDLSRGRITSGSLGSLIVDRSVVGVTTNPTIFAAALADGEAYDAQVRELAASGASVEEAIDALTCHDVAQAADILAPIYRASGGVDGRVSIEVPPHLAHDTEGTVECARKLWEMIDRPNILIKIPATEEGMLAIARTLGEGISVNVTLIFALGRYRKVVEAFISGLERAREAGRDISRIHSVASIFVSRVDSEIDKRLDAIGTEKALSLKGKAGIANCRLAYEICTQLFDSERWDVLEAAGAHRQRPLWASTGTKDPAYPDTLYVSELVTEGVVNTMPEKTLEAFADHGELHGDTVVDRHTEADELFDTLAIMGIDYAEVMEVLEREGLEKFDASWAELVETVTQQLEGAQS